jgi:hypothetical protein
VYAGVGTFSITSLPCVRGCRGTHRTLYATLGTPPALSDLKASTRQRAGRQADSRSSSARVEQALPRLGRPRTGQAGGHRLGPGGWGLAGVGALPRLRIRLLAARKARKPLDIKGIRRRAPPHWAKKKPPAQEPRA